MNNIKIDKSYIRIRSVRRQLRCAHVSALVSDMHTVVAQANASAWHGLMSARKARSGVNLTAAV